MSRALFEHAADGRHNALSAGTTPADRVHLEVIDVTSELGIDLSDRTPQLLTRELAEQADVVVTMGCGDRSKSKSRCYNPCRGGRCYEDPVRAAKSCSICG